MERKFREMLEELEIEYRNFEPRQIKLDEELGIERVYF